MRKPKAELIFERWKAELAGRDRAKSAVAGNFDELFSNWHRNKVTFDEAYALLDSAILAHLPSSSTIRFTFKSLKRKAGLVKTESEFATEWKENIRATGNQMFYSLYEIEDTTTTEQITYGSMSADEYRRQRKYADKIPRLDWESIQLDFIDDDDIDLEDL